MFLVVGFTNVSYPLPSIWEHLNLWCLSRG